jgi:hypothetical protein
MPGLGGLPDRKAERLGLDRGTYQGRVVARHLRSLGVWQILRVIGGN